MTFRQFIDNVKNVGNAVRFYFGRVSDPLGARIATKVGMDVSGSNIAIRSDEVLPSLSSYGNASYEAKRGHLPVTPEALERLPEIFATPDEIVMLPNADYAGRTAFELRKWINGYMVAVVGIANGRHSIEVDPVRIINKKGPPTAADEISTSSSQTSETSSGQALFSTPFYAGRRRVSIVSLRRRAGAAGTGRPDRQRRSCGKSGAK